jgi:hypothetical protein
MLVRFMVTTKKFDGTQSMRVFNTREEAEAYYDTCLHYDYAFESVIQWESMRGWDEPATKSGGQSPRLCENSLDCGNPAKSGESYCERCIEKYDLTTNEEVGL